MKKLILLLEMLALLAVIAAVVVLRSPYAPIVEPVREMEELWAIEDTREESETPLVTALENFGVPLGYDRESNTFYCTLGLDNGDEWPEMKLTVPDGAGTSVCFVDDYAYDWCADAIAEGYSYELMAYNDTHYSYFYIVFTGLPIVKLDSFGEIGVEDTMGTCSIAAGGEESIAKTTVRTHLRGDGTFRYLDKKSFKIEFSRGAKGSVTMNVPGIGATKAINMLAMGFDETYMRDHLSWDVLARVMPDKEVFSSRPAAYAELFVNDEYQGLYLMSTPFEIEEELTKENGDGLSVDNLYRTTSLVAIKDKPFLQAEDEQPYESILWQDNANVFAGLEPYLAMRGDMDDATFIRETEKHVDLDSALTYTLFLEAFALADNTNKNMYIWQHYDSGNYRYRFELWDMDRSWDLDPGPVGDFWYANRVPDRMINLNVGGARQKLYALWQEIRGRGLNIDLVTELVMDYEHQLTASGAFWREVDRWGMAEYIQSEKIITRAQMRLDWMDMVTKFIAETEGHIAFLDVGEREEAHFYPTYDYLTGEGE